MHERLVAPAMHRIGDLWRAGELTVADEHLASRTVIDALARIQPAFIRGAPKGRTAVIGCVEGELHEIGLRAAASVLLGGAR